MFCKYCGDRIDPKGFCVSCGKPVGPLEGGVGFWDLAGKGGRGPSPSCDSVNTASMERLILEGTERLDRGMNHIYCRQTRISKPQTVLLMVIAVLLVAGVLLDMMLLGVVRDIRDVIPETAIEESIQPTETFPPVETEVESEPTVTDNAEEPSKSTVFEEPWKENVNIDEKMMERTNDDFQITRQPREVSLSGKKNGKEELFNIEATGGNLSFKWEKKDEENGVWVAIEETDSYLCVECAEGKSTLYQQEFHESLYGVYRCVVKGCNEEETKYSNEVEVKRVG